MTQFESESSVANFEICLDAANLALASGDKPRAQRALAAAVQAIADRVDMRRELVATMVRLGNLELEMDAAGTARTTFRETLTIGEASLGGTALELLPALKGLASASVSLGALDEARTLVARATEIADQHPDAAQGAFAELLNDVSRFYFKQGAHAEAEPLLQRLLTIKRVKGDEHPEVAAVTASLATTRQALGRYESAEQLWRKVLAIRERTLAPSHFSLATTLEHLAECCAARGKLAEALRLSERALVIRELALGVEHASVRALRERIGDLRLQAAEESVDDAPPVFRTSGPGAVAADSSDDLPPAVPVVLPPPSAPVELPVPAQAAPVPPPLSVAVAPVAATPGLLATAPSQPLQSVLLDIQRDIELAEAPLQTGFLAVLKGFPTALRERRPAAIVGAGAVVVTMAGGLAFGVMARPGGGMEWVIDETARQQGTPSVVTYSGPASATPPIGPTGDSTPADRGVAAPPAGRKAASEERGERAVRPAASAEPGVPTVSRPVMPKLDSVVSRIDVPQTNLEAVPAQRSLGDVTKALSAGNRGAERMETRARLIGAMPTPQYPRQLSWASVGGDVRVRFEVDTMGRPVLATFKAVGSPHPKLVESVRNAIAPLRFEPARSPWPDSKAMVDRVELTFQFKPPGRS